MRMNSKLMSSDNGKSSSILRFVMRQIIIIIIKFIMRRLDRNELVNKSLHNILWNWHRIDGGIATVLHDSQH